MNIREISRDTLAIFRANKQRTLLTMLGIVIGISSVIIIMSVGAGAQSLITNQITSVGSNLIGILPGYSDESGPPASVMGIVVTTLKYADAKAIKREIPEISAATAYVRGSATATYENQKSDVTFVGTTVDYPNVEDARVERGNFFDASHEASLSRVAVLGFQVWQDLFAGQNPLNEQIRIRRENFRVIGVMEKRGTEFFQNQDSLVFIPLETAQKILLGIDHVSMIRAKVKSEQDTPAAVTHIQELLRERHNIASQKNDDFTVRAAAQALDILKQVTGAINLFLAAIAGVSLIVGGVGIMNIMLVSVTERTREIGLRKAVGARSRDIQIQFLGEALILTLGGGVLGLLIGVLFSGLIAVIAQALDFQWAFHVPALSVLLAFGVSAAVGILFGWYPAHRASHFEPVESLRYE